jgi:membrane-bound lytic murein transglycosylase D
MKSLDLDIANLQNRLLESNSSLEVYSAKLSEQDKFILRVARIFGECELNIPKGFVPEVHRYIEQWKGSDRLAKAIETAQSHGYRQIIAQEMLAEDLPPEYFYLALQESNFDAYVIGPKTRKGIAKDIWQFIPKTAIKYGLKVGPLVDLRRPDPGDQRHSVDLATKAAARYIKDLYSTDAQASELLVMASYNWAKIRCCR